MINNRLEVNTEPLKYYVYVRNSNFLYYWDGLHFSLRDDRHHCKDSPFSGIQLAPR